MSNKPYDKTLEKCSFGEYNLNSPAGYTITGADKLCGPWYYVYQNRKILLYVDQNGPVKVQHNPPSGILVCKRELGETQSKWQVWIKSDCFNAGIPVSNFNSPVLDYNHKKPRYTVDFYPEKAVYKSVYDGAEIISELFVPIDKATVCMKTTVFNNSKNDADFTIIPSLFPYINMPQMAPWDLPEWYLSSSTKKNGDVFCFCGQMKDPAMDINNYRSVTFNCDFDSLSEYELHMSDFVRSGNFFAPQSVIENLSFSNKINDNINAKYSERQAVWAMKYKVKIKAGSSRIFTQVLTVQNSKTFDEKENEYECNYFDDVKYNSYLSLSKEFYYNLFSKRSIKTANPVYDNFINSFAPLQMFWVCSLDRGWPSSMRGTRDASQDFIGMTPLNPAWTRETIKELLAHQRSDGWFPRQISTISRSAPHDLRNFCDGGAFFIELLYEYLAFTRDFDLMDEKVLWLDSDKESTVFEHIIKCMEYYLSSENIGEHGLTKAWYGDWWDVIDRVGSEGRGESVTVTAQNVLNLRYLSEIVLKLISINKINKSYYNLIKDYELAGEKFAVALKKFAYNKSGYFNGYFNDDGKWLFSDDDPDGEKRLYLVANAWGIISGVADNKMQKKIIGNIEKMNFDKLGYNTNSLAFKKFVDKAGRVGNLSISEQCPYNHAQSFLVRAMCVAGNAQKAYKTTRYILPIEQDYAPVEKTFASPYCIANAYSNSDENFHRIELQFLSGTVSYVLRTVYSYFFGITFGLEGLTIKYCMPKEFGNSLAHFEYLGGKFTLGFVKNDAEEKIVKFNGKIWTKKVYCEQRKKEFPFFADSDFEKENIIEIEY